MVCVMPPPPLWGPPPPLCGPASELGAVVKPDLPGVGWVGDGGGSNGAALTAPNPNISGDMATPAAIAAAPTARLRFIGFRFPCRFCVDLADQRLPR